MRAVNLLPADTYAPKQRLPHAHVVFAAALPVLAAALVYLGYALEHSKVVKQQNALGAVQSQIAALGPSRSLVDESTRVAGERTVRLSALQSALTMQIPWDVDLSQLARIVPRGSWLTALSAQSPTPATVGTAGPASPTSFTLQGYAPTHDAVATLLERLQLLPSLSQVALTSTELTPVGKKNFIQFDITASLQHAPEPSGGATS
jgi:Tfp pilus assembly protein PilN